MVKTFTSRTPDTEKSENWHTSSFRPAQTYLAIFGYFLGKRQKIQASTKETVWPTTQSERSRTFGYWCSSMGDIGPIQANSDHPRSYIVSTRTGLIRQSRQHLNQSTDERDQPPTELASIAIPSMNRRHSYKQEQKSGHLIACSSNELEGGCGIRLLCMHNL